MSTGNSKLLQIDTGILNLQDACVIIVKTEWNEDIIDAMEDGCRKVLVENGLQKIITISVPGAFEIPFGIKSYWDALNVSDRPKAFIGLGCVIRGDTPHFDFISKAVTDGIMQLNLLLPVPTIFGVLTVNNHQQAVERIGGKHGHKGEEAALTAIKMMALQASITNKE